MKEKEAKQIIESEFGNLKKESRSQYDTLVSLLVKYGADASRPVEKLGYSEGASQAMPEPNIFEEEWIDTKKQLPDNGRFVIIYWDNGYHNQMDVASYDALDMQWYDHNREPFTDDVTHWREFPPRP